jgi:hypothetical protein
MKDHPVVFIIMGILLASIAMTLAFPPNKGHVEVVPNSISEVIDAGVCDSGIEEDFDGGVCVVCAHFTDTSEMVGGDF